MGVFGSVVLGTVYLGSLPGGRFLWACASMESAAGRAFDLLFCIF